MRGPVNAFAGVAELIRHYIEEKAYDDLVEITEDIDQSSSQLSTLLDNLLNWAVSQQGEFPYNPEQTKLVNIGEEIQGIFKNISSSKNIILAIEVAPEVEAWTDKKPIFRNLINNALKFTESGGQVTLLLLQRNPKQSSR